MDETSRIAAVRESAILDTAAEPPFDRLTALAARLLDVPIAVITIVDRDRQWFKSRVGLDLIETPRELSFCAHTINGNCEGAGAGDGAGEVLVVEDAAADPRFARNVLVTDGPRIRFYAGAPVCGPSGARIGALGVMDRRPRALSPAERALLARLAAVATSEVALSALIRAASGPAARASGPRDAAAARHPALDADSRLHFVTEQLPAILWTTDRDLRFTSSRGAGLGAIGLAPNQVVGVALEDFFAAAPEGWRHVAAHRAALDGRGSSTEVWFSGRAYQTRIDPLRDAAGDITGTIGVALDITERVRSEEAVRRSEARYRLIAQATNDVVWDWNIETGEMAWNDSLAGVFRYPRDAVGFSLDWWSAHIHPDDRDRVLGTLRGVVDTDATIWNEEYRFERGDGSYAVVFDRGFLSRDPRGRAVRMIGSMVDITESKVMEAKLIQAERLASMGTLAAGVAHEINNPLTYVMANVGFVSERLTKLARTFAPDAAVNPDDPAHPLARQIDELGAALGEAQEGAVRVRQIVRDLKVFSRGDQERYGPVDVRRVIESSLSMVWNEIRHRARVVKQLGPVPLVEASESRLGQVFLNLLVNAAQAIKEGNASANEIRVSTGTDAAGCAEITVADSGVGISPEVIGRIFDPFFTTKPVGVGTGLGLFICHGIVKALGGEITVQSGSEGGTCFRVVLPPARADLLAPRAGAGPPAEPAKIRRRVLLIDDEVHLATGLERALAAEHDVVLATSGRDAQALLGTDDRFDVILCDLMMPEMTGMDVFAYLARERPHLTGRVVFMTGGAFTAGARAFLEQVPNPSLDKPFDMERLRAVIRDLV